MTQLIPHTIRVHIPHARQVAILGDFNNWHSNAHPLAAIASDLWEGTVDLPCGRNRFAFFIVEGPAVANWAIRTRVLGNGAVLWVPENPEHSYSISGHPSMSLRRVEALQAALQMA